MRKIAFKGILASFGFLLLFGCKREPKLIQYGTDACHFCRMTIVDKIHGAEMITDKGKVYKFDAAECLVHYKSELEDTEDYIFLSNYFESPGDFVEMKNARFLISKQLPSPMGAFLTAFKSKEVALELKKQKGGEVYSFEEILKRFNH